MFSLYVMKQGQGLETRFSPSTISLKITSPFLSTKHTLNNCQHITNYKAALSHLFKHTVHDKGYAATFRRYAVHEVVVVPGINLSRGGCNLSVYICGGLNNWLGSRSCQ